MRRAVLAVGVVMTLAACTVEAAPADPVEPTEQSASLETVEVTAADVVNAMKVGKIAEFCDYYLGTIELMGFEDGDAFAFAAFEEGYGSGDPPAAEVFTELVSRCGG